MTRSIFLIHIYCICHILNDISLLLMIRQRALLEPERCLLRLRSTEPHSEIYKSGTRRVAIRNISKRYGDVPQSKNTKAARGRAAIRNISKRYEDVPHSEIYQSGNKLPHSKKVQVEKRGFMIKEVRSTRLYCVHIISVREGVYKQNSFIFESCR